MWSVSFVGEWWCSASSRMCASCAYPAQNVSWWAASHSKSTVVLPLMVVPFQHIDMDFIGPFNQSSWGYCFVLLLMIYATWYLEAMALCNKYCASAVLGHLPSRHSKRDTVWPGNLIHILHTKRIVWIAGWTLYVCSARGALDFNRSFTLWVAVQQKAVGGLLELMKDNWQEGPSPGKNKIQCILDLRTKLVQNLLQAQEC